MTIRAAATTIVLRELSAGPSVLMGQRGAGAAFMPSKFVFPGGAVDASDAGTRFARDLSPVQARALAVQSDIPPEALAAAALRELAEETGQVVGQTGQGCDWPGYRDHLPDASALTFIFRAITPPGRPRRFDARFFLIRADDLSTDPDCFDAADDELAHLHWVPLDEASALDVPFVTEVALAEVSARLRGEAVPGVPFFDNSGPGSIFRRL